MEELSSSVAPPRTKDELLVTVGSGNASLQDAFARFREQRKSDRKLMKNCSKTGERSSEFKNALRQKFIEQAMKYKGIPYHEKYREEGTPIAPLYLDCCGVIRQVMKDLKQDFGFIMGPWNQAYQMDTLPDVLSFEQLKPGDLIFYEGIFNSKRSKPQKHNNVHVEIFIGGETGEATLGARFQKGVVSEFPSYKFVSKTWDLVQYHFRSIDSWLDGRCVSCCPEHSWLSESSLRYAAADRKSIFNDDVDIAGESAGDDGEDICDDVNTQQTHENISLQENQQEVKVNEVKIATECRKCDNISGNITENVAPLNVPVKTESEIVNGKSNNCSVDSRTNQTEAKRDPSYDQVDLKEKTSHYLAGNILLQPYILPFLDFQQLATLSEINKYHTSYLATEHKKSGYWEALCTSLAAQYGIYCPELRGLNAREYFFKEIWPARKKWNHSGIEQNFDINVACRFRPGPRNNQSVSLPLHQFLKVKRKQIAIGCGPLVGEAPKEEYLDALLGNIMIDPVQLPSSKKVVERSVGEDCARRGRDPFDNSRLTERMLISLPELSCEIKEYRKRQDNYNVDVGIDEMGALIEDTVVDPQLLQAVVAAERISFVSRRAAHDVLESDINNLRSDNDQDQSDNSLAGDGNATEEVSHGPDALENNRMEADRPESNFDSTSNEILSSGFDDDSSKSRLSAVGAARWRGKFNTCETPQIISVDQKKSCVAMHVPGLGVRPFYLNSVYHASNAQSDVYRGSVRDLVVSAINGTNACALCYGQTGSGKTFTMFGPDDGDLSVDSPVTADELLNKRSAGSVLLACNEILRAITTFKARGNISLLITAQFAEVYNEQITDLLSGNAISSRRSDGRLIGGREVVIENADCLVAMLREGQTRKHFASTAMNQRSSRAHTILVFSISQTNLSNNVVLKSHLYLVDLAGSERVKKSRVEGNNLVEATSINSSLLVLGKVISNLAHAEIHIPYLESKLTTILKGAFGGNSRTCVIVTCRSDDKKFGDETLQSLRFGERCGMISNQTKTAATSVDSVLETLNYSIDSVDKQLKGLLSRGKQNIPSFKALELKFTDLKRHKENIEKNLKENSIHSNNYRRQNDRNETERTL